MIELHYQLKNEERIRLMNWLSDTGGRSAVEGIPEIRRTWGTKCEYQVGGAKAIFGSDLTITAGSLETAQTAREGLKLFRGLF